VAIGDLDGDGKPDMVVANTYDGSVWVYRNLSTNGTLASASFAPPVVFAIGGGGDSIYALTLADLDGDGRLDIVVANRNFNIVSIFQNLSSPGSLTTGSFGTRVDLSVPGVPSGLAVADLDGDGKPEIVTANNNSSSVSILQNVSTGGLLTSSSFAAPLNLAVGSGPWTVALVDVNGDGKPDIITVNQNDSTHKVSILRNLAVIGTLTTSSFAPAVSLPGSGEYLTVGDLDGDGKPDVVVGYYSGASIYVYRNTVTNGSLTTNSFASPIGFGAGGDVHAVALADLDGDGKPDVVAVSQGDKLSVFKNTSTPGSFTSGSLGTRIDYPVGSNPVGVAIGDLDGDGRPDIAVGNAGGNTVGVYRNVIPFGFAPQVTLQPTNQTVVIAGTATFNSAASGSSPLSYQWLLNGTNLVRATNATLVVTNVQPGNAGAYALLVTNIYGTALSSNAVLSIGYPPVITNQPAGQRVSAGCGVTFGVGVTGTAPLSYQWWKAAAAIGGQTNSSLTLQNVQTDDFTNYSVTVSNSFGSTTSSNAALTQDHAPVAVQDIIQRHGNGNVKVLAAALLANDTDPDGDALTFAGVSSNSAAGGTVIWSGDWVYYLPPDGYTNSDAFNYYVSDGYCGGVTNGYVLVQITTPTGSSHNFTIAHQPDGSVLLTFAGIPGWTYRVQYADTLPIVNWTDLSTNTADSSGVYQYIDYQATNSASRFYRSVSP
jgi:hypothetical protein